MQFVLIWGLFWEGAKPNERTKLLWTSDTWVFLRLASPQRIAQIIRKGCGCPKFSSRFFFGEFGRYWNEMLFLASLGCFKPGCLQVLLRNALCALLRSFALTCARLRSFALICVFLRPTAFRMTAFGNFRIPKMKMASGKLDQNSGTLLDFLFRNSHSLLVLF